MKLIKTLTWSVAVATGLFMAGLAHASAQQPDRAPGQDQSRERAPEAAASISGELTRVDAQAMAFSVKATAGAEMVFKYDEKTVVTGAQNTVAGLATSRGSDVTVQYRKDAGGNIASKIEVHAKR